MKSSWRHTSICGKDVWFAVHRFCMVLTLLLTIAGSVLILIEIKGWSNTKNIHPIVGVITVALTFVQSFIGFLRPGPGSRSRPLFNWVHFGIGNLAHIFAIVSIFFATKLEKAELPQNIMDLLLGGFVLYHLCAHLLFTVRIFLIFLIFTIFKIFIIALDNPMRDRKAKFASKFDSNE